MAKQEEIKEGIAIELGCYSTPEGRCFAALDYYPLAERILKYLHSQGVVIKVERELPDIEDYCQLIQGYSDYSGRMSGYRTAQEDMAEYVAVEPLIKKAREELSES